MFCYLNLNYYLEKLLIHHIIKDIEESEKEQPNFHELIFFKGWLLFENGDKTILPIFSERTALLLKKQIPTLDRSHIIAISSAVAYVFSFSSLASLTVVKECK